jgi:hypothetical protein
VAPAVLFRRAKKFLMGAKNEVRCSGGLPSPSASSVWPKPSRGGHSSPLGVMVRRLQGRPGIRFWADGLTHHHDGAGRDQGPRQRVVHLGFGDAVP